MRLNKRKIQIDAEVDLLAVENGGVEVACSNHHYGEPKNMIKVCLPVKRPRWKAAAALSHLVRTRNRFH